MSINVKYWAIKKWQWIVDNWDYDRSDVYNTTRMVADIPELDKFRCQCSYCQKYMNSHGCGMCPLKDIDHICCKEYNGWCRNIGIGEDGTENAKLMLKRIKENKDA